MYMNESVQCYKIEQSVKHVECRDGCAKMYRNKEASM